MRVLAHGVGAVYELPLPLELYLGGAAAVVMLSFFVQAFSRRAEGRGGERPVLGPAAASTVITFLRAVAFVLLILTVVFAILEGGSGFVTTPLLFWVGLIIVTAALQSLAEGVWQTANAWSTIEDLLALKDAPPREIALKLWWLGPLLLYALFWFELVSGEGFDSLAVLIVLLSYTLFVIGFRRALASRWDELDPLSILFGFAGRVAPMRLDRNGLFYRGWLVRLVELNRMPLALFVAVFVLLGSTTFDNVRETVEWNDFVNSSGLASVPNRLVDSVALAFMAVPFLVAFGLAVVVARRWRNGSLLDVARHYAWSLIPIGVAYLLAHNMPLLITGLPQIATQIAEEFGIDLFGRYVPSPRLVWTLEIVIIVGGHVLGVACAHRIALALTADRTAAAKSHVALTVVMAVFTVVTLWLLSLPLVVPR
jgi:hypothetical protein